jgi:transmembrane sensor
MEYGKELELIMSRLSGNISPEKDKILTDWINSSAMNQHFYRDAEKIWNASGTRLLLNDPDTEQEWVLLRKRLLKRPGVLDFSRPQVWFSIAACAAILILGIFQVYKSNVSIPEKLLKVTATNEVKTFYLPDSSRIWLNINSELSYPETFNRESRVIYLTGQAYFIVRPDSVRPFTIQTRDASIVVLGTTFDAEVSDSTANVVVEEGKVSLRENRSEKEVVLTRGERGTQRPGSVTQAPNTDTQVGSWRKRNNPEYSREAKNALRHLRENHTTSKNQLNQTVIDGTIRNRASLVTLSGVVLKVTSRRPNGKETITRFYINQRIKPGERITYKRRLLDIFNRRTDVTVELEKVTVAP